MHVVHFTPICGNNGKVHIVHIVPIGNDDRGVRIALTSLEQSNDPEYTVYTTLYEMVNLFPTDDYNPDESR